MKKIVLSLVILISAFARADEYFISVDEASKLVGKDNVRFVFADDEKAFEKAHIPGSVDAFAHDLNYLDDVKKCKGLPMCEPTAVKFIGTDLGVDNNTQVIAYDSGMGVNASGVWFFLSLYGHKNVKILDGGMATWAAKNLPTEAGAPKKPAAKKFAAKVNHEIFATKDEVLKATKEKDKYLILDSRHKLDEYTGKELLSALAAPGKEITVKNGGNIPTSVFSPWKKFAGNGNGEPNKPTLKDEKELQKQLDKLKKNGYEPNKTLITYCHVGLGRGSFQYLALKKAGVKNAKVYVGSWNEWGNTDGLPVSKGEGSAE